MTQKDIIFEHEFLPYADALTNFAYYLTQDEDEAEDLTQDTLIKAYNAGDTYHQGTNARAWLFRIMKNAFINDYKKRKRRGKQVDITEAVATVEEEHPQNYLPEEEHSFMVEELGDETMNAVNHLPLEYRTILMLCYIEEFKYDELAVIFEIPIGTVRSRLSRARTLLKAELKSYADKLGYLTKEKKEGIDN